MIVAIKQIDFSNYLVVIGFTLLLAIIIFFRYLIVSGVYHVLFYKLFKKKFTNKILYKKPLKRKQLVKEVYWSAISGLIFSAFAVLMFYLWEQGWTAIYTDISQYTLWYLPLSLFLLLFIQDTYYYWIHRLMHIPAVYKVFHKVHHKSVHTSVLTSFSFHPLETILQAVILPFIILFLPLHIYVIVFALVIMTISATINHAGVEVYPSGKFGNWFKKWIIGATHHDYHHTKFNYNYGLYFTFWDYWMGTELEEK